MKLTQEQQALLNGEKGQTMAKVMKTLVMYGEIFGAEKMVPVTSRYNHLVTSFGLKALGPVYDLMDQLIAAGAVSGQKFSADPRPLDPKVPANFLQNLVFKKFMYSKQDFYGGQLKALGLKDKLPEMSEEEQLSLLATDGMLVKRPILVGEDFVRTGFRQAEWETALG